MTSWRSRVHRAWLCAVMLGALNGLPASRPVSAQAEVPFDSQTIAGLGARNIGAAKMSGRISALTGVVENGKVTLYVGAASGGLWKSSNGGTTFEPVFDKQPVQSIGAIAVDPSNPRNLWVGTGESWTRNSVSVGDGVYKSTDGGDTWVNVGLRETERIARIVVDPKDGNTVHVCAPGKLWSDSDERGVFRTTDGGKSWTKVLKGANLSTGCGMLAMSADSDTLYASLWDFRRKGWTFRSGGDGPTASSGSGLYKSTDRGATWGELTAANAKGLPARPWGRIALAAAPSKPNVVYAFVEGTRSALFRSDDSGGTWAELDRSQNMVWRPFYFANLIVDPRNDQRLFKTNLSLIMSVDGGRSFSVVAGSAHGDFHDVWINPQNTNHLVAGDDGGIWYSYDGGAKWWKAENLPVSQFYHVAVDMAQPYRVYGGLQDNSAWIGDSSYPGGVTNARWEVVPAGDGFWMFPDPADPDYLYAESQGGEIMRFNRRTREARNIKPRPRFGEKLRFNWNTPIHLSPTEAGTIYIGAQFLFRSRDQGQSWDRISPDLTTNDPAKQKQEESGGITVDNSAAEMHTTIYTISESPRNGKVLWVGTDDGNVQLTRDGGANWSNVVSSISGLPANSWVAWIEASRFDEATAYAAFDRHTFGDMAPYMYRTTDFGRTWTRLIGPEQGVRGFAHVVREDTVNRDLLFVGTESGLWISIDGGRRWAQYTGGNFPSVPVRDVVVHPRDADLVIATHGRGMWIIDDITPLRTLTSAILSSEAALLQASGAVQAIPGLGGWPEGDATFVGPGENNAATITFYQRRRHIFGPLQIDVLDSAGRRLEEITGSPRRGLNRVSWSMRVAPPRVPPAATLAFGAAIGPRVLPGKYTVRLTKGKQVFDAEIAVQLDPRSTHTLEDRRRNFDTTMRLHGMLGDMSYLVDQINVFRRDLAGLAAKLPEKDAARARFQAISSSADEIRRKIVATREGGAITGEERLRERMADLYGVLVSYEGRPAEYQLEAVDVLARELKEVTAEMNTLTAKTLPEVNKLAAGRQLKPITILSRQAWEK